MKKPVNMTQKTTAKPVYYIRPEDGKKFRLTPRPPLVALDMSPEAVAKRRAATAENEDNDDDPPNLNADVGCGHVLGDFCDEEWVVHPDL